MTINVKNHSHFQSFIFLRKNILFERSIKTLSKAIFLLFSKGLVTVDLFQLRSPFSTEYIVHIAFILFLEFISILDRVAVQQTAVHQRGGLGFNLSHFIHRRRELFPIGGLIRGCLCVTLVLFLNKFKTLNLQKAFRSLTHSNIWEVFNVLNIYI